MAGAAPSSEGRGHNQGVDCVRAQLRPVPLGREEMRTPPWELHAQCQLWPLGLLVPEGGERGSGGGENRNPDIQIWL